MPALAPIPSRLLLTGASGQLGQVLREPLRNACLSLKLSDNRPLRGAPLTERERFEACQLGDRAAVRHLLRDVDAVVHLGGVSVEGPFDPILEANILGLYNLYEAARRHGVPRIVFASSNHVTGCYRQGERIGPHDRPRPDGNYGLSKLFGEGLAQLYFDRYRIETVCLRIGTSTVSPPDRRGLSTWLSHRDLAQLVLCALSAPNVGNHIVFGASANPASWWDNAEAAARIGFEPQDSAEAWRAEVEAQPRPDPASPTTQLQGGSFLGIGPFDD
jgi:uronate dehydrogenase